MKFRIGANSGLSVEVHDSQRCNFGILEGLGLGFGLADIGAAFGIGDAAAAAGAGTLGAETGLGTIGAGLGTATATGGIADIVGTGAGLAGGETGLAGTLAAGGSGLGVADLAGGTAGLGALGTATDFLGAPAASGFNAAAVTPGAAGFSTDSAIASLTGTPTASTPTVGSGSTAVGGGNSVFNTGANPLPGVGSGGQPAAVGASAVSAPSGVAPAAGIDPTAAAGQVPGAVGPTSVGGAPVAGGTGSTSSISDLLGKAGQGITDSVTKNPLGIGLGAAGLGYNILQGQKQTANQKALAADAASATANSNNLAASGAALEQYLTNGTLPANYQAEVDKAIQDAKTSAISNAAAQGLPTDPTKNTALATTLAQIDASRANMQTQVASQLFSSGAGLTNAGLSAAGLSGQLYQALVQNDTTQAANTGKAIATLAAALNGKSQASAGGTTITVGS